MPYIPQRERALRNDPTAWQADTPGELNYAVTRLVTNYLKDWGHSYSSFNAVIGVLECAKQELYRRLVAPYEDKKCAEHGDVYDAT